MGVLLLQLCCDVGIFQLLVMLNLQANDAEGARCNVWLVVRGVAAPVTGSSADSCTFRAQ